MRLCSDASDDVDEGWMDVWYIVQNGHPIHNTDPEISYITCSSK